MSIEPRSAGPTSSEPTSARPASTSADATDSGSPEARPAADDAQLLAQAIREYELPIEAEKLALLQRYCQALWQWNERLNLTRHTDYAKFVARDLTDSWQLAQQIPLHARVLDIGSGGGVPGVPLAILRPDLKLTLSDSVAKKARALEAIVAETGLKLPVYHGPAQELLATQRFDTLTVRAVAPLTKLLLWFKPHWESIGQLLVIKGPAWVEERYEARQKLLLKGKQLRKLATWPLAGTSSESVLLEIISGTGRS